MKYRVKEYTINGLMIILPYEITIEDLCKLTNETLEITLCSSMFKNKALVKKDGIWTEVPNAVSVNGNIITVNLEACALQPTDKLTIEIDKGGGLSSEDINLFSEASVTLSNINLVGVEELSTFFGLPSSLPDYEVITNEEICSTLEEIMTSMDLDLTSEMAATITNNTLNE